ncbi:probable G-protein coupled receptor 179 isoform X3 [Melanerpes formicivorus]|uniref:probable G-protein coupled receptor 179 isoform X3 n=1 Tax=Melanerpes formicivorus TaxID=211600 RepID=UPI00358E0C07
MGPRRWPLLWCLQAVLLRGTVLVGGQRPQERPPRPAGWSSASSSSSWMPTAEPGAPRDPEGSAAAMLFLQTGDAQRLARANCSRGVVAGAAGASPPAALRATLRAAPEALAHAANFLNMLFQTNDIREASVAEDVEWYQALVRSLAEGHPWVHRAVLALDAHPLAAKPRLMLQATKGGEEILLRDVSAAAPSSGNLSWDNEWFNSFKSQRTPPLRKRLLSNDLSSMDTPKWQRGDSYVGEPGHVRWSPPFLQCQDGKFLPSWMVTLSSAFYGLKPDLSPEFKGVVRVDIELRDVAIDQCSPGPGWFADTHRCDLNSTQCVPQEGRGFVLGRYLCRCKPGFYRAGGVASGARAGAAGADGGSRLACRPCRQGCATCEDDAPCLIQEDRALRAAVLSCQACCMLAVFLSMLVSYHYRRSKRIRTSGVVLLETILFGSLLLYFPVFILYFKPSIFRCILLRWVRLLGFAIVYGTITLKLYRVLKVFLSRPAPRVPCASSERVLKMLGLILLLVLWFLAAWTIGMLENIDKNIPLVVLAQTSRGLHFYICSHDHWDYMMVIAEMLFLLWGSFLCYATRAVPSAFHEPRYLGIALHNELLVSATFHVVRFIMVPSLHPDWTLLLFFAHTHGTITMTLALLFIPKLLHAGSPLREEIAAEVYEDQLDVGRSGSCLTSSVASAWSEHSLDPDDIREELKKLYLQLEVHKARKMATNNPHLGKRRSSRRSLLRSLARRGAEPPEVLPRRGSTGPGPGPGERLGTPARRSSSAKRLPDASGASLRMREEGSRRRAAALRKSRSAEGARGEPPAGSPSSPGGLEGKAVAVAASEPSDSESLDAAPLVCRSASAHNLAGPGQLPLPRAAPLQKSLSAGAQDEALLAASRTAWHPRRHPAPAPGPPKAAGGASPAGRSPRQEEPPPGEAKVQKRVSYAPVKSISVDSSHPPGRVRVAVKRTPPPPPVRYQSLGQRPTAATGSLETAEPPPAPLARAAEPRGAAGEEEAGGTAPPAGKGRLLPAASIPAQVCPWELLQEEILSQKQRAAEAAALGTPGGAEATPSPSPSFQKASLRSLGLAIKAFNRSRGRSILRGKGEAEGSLRKRGQEGGSRRERLSLAETSAPEGSSHEWSRQRPSSEPTAHPWQGGTALCQHNNNAASSWGAEGWWDRGTEGHGDSPALGTGHEEGLAEEPSAPRGAADAGGALEPPSGLHLAPPSAGHREGAEGPHEALERASSGQAQAQCQEGAEAPAAEPGQEAPAAPPGLGAPKEVVAGLGEGLRVSTGSLPARGQAGAEQPPAGSLCPSWGAAGEPGAELCAQGAPGGPAGRGALLRQQAMASREDAEPPAGRESPARALEQGGSPPQLLGPRRVPPRSQSLAVAPGPAGRGSREAEGGAGEAQADARVRVESCPWEESRDERRGAGRAPGQGGTEGVPRGPGEELGVEKPPAERPRLLKAASGQAESVEGSRAEGCPWEAGEGARSSRAEICPWDTEEAQVEQERLGGERRQQLRSSRATSGGLLRAQERGSRGSAETPPKAAPKSSEPPLGPAPQSSELPGVSSRSLLSTLASVCPWESLGMEQPPERLPRSPALPKAPAKESQSGDSLKAEVCPWEAAEVEPTQKAEICPWESTDRQQPPERLPRSPVLPKAPAKKSQSRESLKAEICPWEGTDREQLSPQPPARSPALPKAPSRESLKAEICPWESTDREQPPEKPQPRSPTLPKAPSKESQSRESLKAEVCPWEAPEVEPTQKAEICPWESTDREQPPEKPQPRSPTLPKAPSKKSQSGDSLKAEVCPWEAPEVEPTQKAEICPWESTDVKQPPERPQPRSPTLPKAPGKKSQSRESLKAEICPWESTDREQLPPQPPARSPTLPKAPSKKSQSGDSLKAEVCPWEAPGAGGKAEVCPWEAAGAGAGGKAEVCPWEVAAPAPANEKPRQPQAALSMVSRSSWRGKGVQGETGGSTAGRKEAASSGPESICPWESTDTESSSPGHGRRSTELLGASSRKAESRESLKAEVCPWEAAEVESTQKAEICPWETDREQPPEKPQPRSPVLPKAPSRESLKAEICPWESTDREQLPPQPPAKSPTLPKAPSKKSQSGDSLKAEICPWEAAEVEPTQKAEICPWESTDREQPPERPQPRSPTLPKAPSKKSQSGDSLKAEICPWEAAGAGGKAEICPWESTDREQPPEKPQPRSPTLPKAPSKESQSGDSLKAEVCPWEAPEVKPTQKAEICPWESTDREQPPEKPQPRSPTLPKAPSKKSQSRESLKAEICPWESTDREQLPPQPPARSPTLPKAPSRESLKAEVCPWEAPEVESTQKAEICPWESTDRQQPPEKPQPRSPTLPKAPGKKSQSRESLKAEICPWESTDVKQPPEKPQPRSPVLPKAPSKKSQSGDSLKAEICPWEAPEVEPTQKAEICPWESTDRQQPPEKPQPRSPTLPKAPSKKSQSRESLKAEVCPWESTDREQLPQQPAARSPTLPKAPSRESLKAEVCPWEAPEVEPTQKAEICPWEAAGAGAGGKAEVCPWEAAGAGAGGKAEICPWEAAGAGAGGKAEVCPWEAAGAGAGGKAEIYPWEAAGAGGKAEVCPWEAAGAGAGGKAEICPWEAAGAGGKAEICPWEAAELSSLEQQSSHPAAAGRASPVGKAESALPAGGSSSSAAALPRSSGGRPSREAEHKPLCRLSGGSQHPRGARAAPRPGGASLGPGPGSSPGRVCPWEAEEAPPAAGDGSPGASRASEVCPWEVESLDPPQGCQQGRAGAGAEPTAEVCPWDQEELPPEQQRGAGRVGIHSKP